MTTWLLPCLTALLGYLVHWATVALAGRKEREAEDRARMLDVRGKLKELLDYSDTDFSPDGHLFLELITDEVELLHNPKFRRRILYCCRHIRDWQFDRGAAGFDDARWEFVQDAVACLNAGIRGDQLPGFTDSATRMYLAAEQRTEIPPHVRRSPSS
ncbi:hypothetical protein ACFYXW_27615 [Streptomyces sp. NPDC001981]|uniref:hypothetical protein n=1 Tax=Streptomyces sp. NPDC001981 TaxID=3364628 RepID=UPI0036824D3F